jgi:penicillin-binding protein 1C
LKRRTKGLLFVCLLAIGFAFYVEQLDGTLHPKSPSHVVVDRHQEFIGEILGSDEAQGYWPLPNELPERIVITTLETEDRKFFEHSGINFKSVARAVFQNAKNARVISGASTISMQVARMQHPAKRSLWAKLKQAGEGFLLIKNHGHDVVLRQYLTLAPYGTRCHGIARASRLYFNKPLEDLSWLEASYLAALPQAPRKMTPWTESGHQRALKRAHRILKSLNERHIIDDETLRVSLKTDIALAQEPKRIPSAIHALLAMEKELKESKEVFHESTLDLVFQEQTSHIVSENLATFHNASAGNSAAIVVDTKSGSVLAYVGSANYFDVENRGAIDFLKVKRSPGSSLKPFIYTLALERKSHTAATLIKDTSVDFELSDGTHYAPENITHTFLGPMLLRQALGNSRNIPAINVLSDIGVERAVSMLERAGVTGVRSNPEAYGLALAVGSLHLTPLELATLYSSLANDGVPLSISLMRTNDGLKPRLFSSESTMLMTHILSDSEARKPSFPNGSALDFDSLVAVKTGTSQGYRDAWASAYNDRLLVITWVGNHDNRRMHQVSGAIAAAPATKKILDELSAQFLTHIPLKHTAQLPPHSEVSVCALSGKIPSKFCTHTKSEVFLPGTEPTDLCDVHLLTGIDIRNQLLATQNCAKQFVIKRPMLHLPFGYESWAKKLGLELAPIATSPLCPVAEVEPKISISEPKSKSRFLFDPDTPAEFSTVKFAAKVTPENEDVVWIVDGVPTSQVGFPHEWRWPISKGTHSIRARLARSGLVSSPVTIVVND